MCKPVQADITYVRMYVRACTYTVFVVVLKKAIVIALKYIHSVHYSYQKVILQLGNCCYNAHTL